MSIKFVYKRSYRIQKQFHFHKILKLARSIAEFPLIVCQCQTLQTVEIKMYLPRMMSRWHYWCDILMGAQGVQLEGLWTHKDSPFLRHLRPNRIRFHNQAQSWGCRLWSLTDQSCLLVQTKKVKVNDHKSSKLITMNLSLVTPDK